MDTTNSRTDFKEVVRYYEDIIYCMPGNVYILDQDCRGVCCNKNVLIMLRLNLVDEFKGLDFDELKKLGRWTNETTEKFKQDTLDVIQSGQPKLNVEEPPIPSHEDKMIYFLTSRVPLFDQSHNVVGVVGISIDITERKKFEQELQEANKIAQEANKVKTQFIQNMQHDIRTPTSGIWSVLACLAEQESDPVKREKLILLKNSAGQLLSISNTVIDFDQIEHGEIPIINKKINILQLASSVVELNQAAASHKNISLTLQVNPDVPPVTNGDAFRVSRILINLIGNAIKFTHQGSIELLIKLVQSTDKEVILQFIIKDTGIGIPHDKKDFIYEKFNRLNPSNQGLYKGTGLGLYIVKQFVDELNGAIEVESLLNKGTTFYITLPFQHGLPQEIMDDTIDFTPDTYTDEKSLSNSLLGTTTVPTIIRNNKLFVLLVEDDALARIAAQSILQNELCDVHVAVDVVSAKKMLDTHHFDLVISDIGLPDGSGFDIIHYVKNNKQSINFHVPFIALTAHIDKAKLLEAEEAGFIETFSKPLDKTKLHELINAAYPIDTIK